MMVEVLQGDCRMVMRDLHFQMEWQRQSPDAPAREMFLSDIGVTVVGPDRSGDLSGNVILRQEGNGHMKNAG